MNSGRILLAVGVLVAVVLGCEREETVRTYQAPKDPLPPTIAAPMPGPAGAMGSAGSAALSRDEPAWIVPDGWEALPAAQMRFAAFAVDADDPETVLTVIPLGPEAGQILPNIHRWEQQIGREPSSPQQLDEIVSQLEINGNPAALIDLEGPRERTLLAIFPRPQRIWFFKLTGSHETIAKQQEKFDQFVRSVRFAELSAAAHDHSHDHADDDHDHADEPKEPAWTLPDGWIADAERPMRFATLRTSQAADAPEIVVSRFGQFGTMLDNINRWRNMVGLDPVEHEKDQPAEAITIGGYDGVLFDMTGPARDGEPSRRMLLAMTPVDGMVWFFRMTGTADTVGDQRDAFDEFLESVRFE